jgi:TatA/E family protein of Tat protein translocase
VPFEGAFSPLHILVVAVVALLVLGPDQLPKAARTLGTTMREFRRVQAHLHSELRDVVTEFDNRTGEPAPPLPSTDDQMNRSGPARPPGSGGAP